jgi:hypothetical protein
MESGYYVYNVHRHLCAMSAYKACEYKFFDRLEDAEACSHYGESTVIDRITVRKWTGSPNPAA